jgi:hypothetical protein
MRKSLPGTFILLLSLISFQSINAQSGIIKDPDGFCNIRETPTAQSKVQDTLSNGRLVYMLPEGPVSNWLSIDYNKGTQYRSGYVHRSRVVFLKDMSPFKATIENDTLLKMELNDMQITIKIGKFAKTGRKIIYNEDQVIETIDGKHTWGNDLMPTNEYKSIQFKSGIQTLTFPKTWFNDLFSTMLYHTSAYHDNTTNTVYILADNGDASLSYTCVWIIKSGQIVHREVFAPF